MEFMNQWWGINENISPVEIAERSVVMFIIALLLVRISGMRPFGKGESFDRVIAFLIGAILSRGVVGATPFFSTVVSMVVIVAIHMTLSKLSVYSRWFGKKVKGSPHLLFKSGKFLKDNMNRVNITEHDIYEELRSVVQTNSLDKIEEVYIERTGKISFVKKQES